MKTEINLTVGNKAVKKKTYTMYVFWLFGGIVAFAVMLMVINVILKLQYSSLDSQERDLTTKINAQADKKVNMLVISERIKNINALYAKRGDFDKQLNELVSIFPSSVTISQITAEHNEFTLSLSAKNLQAMNQVLENDLPAFLKEHQKEIQMVDVNSFQAQRGDYLLTLRFMFPGGLSDE